MREYTELPDELPSVIHETAREVTVGAQSDYDRAVMLQDFFTLSGGFQYDTQVDVGSGSQAIARFLKEKRGFCVHYSFAMASMARSLGIPARIAVGFAPGTPQADGTISVAMRDAHAWPELYFEGAGWTRFEPTPTRGSTPDYTVPDVQDNGPADPARPSQAVPSDPEETPSQSTDCRADGGDPGSCESESPQAALPVDDDGPKWHVVLLWALAGLLVLALPLSPLLWRTRMRAVRLGGHGRTEEDVAPYVLAAWEELTDTAWDHGIEPDESLTPRGAADRIVRTGGLDGDAAASVRRLAGAVEQVLYAPRPRPAVGLAEDVRRASGALRDSASRGARLRALLAPRSAVRVVWAVSDRWASLRDRLVALRPGWHLPTRQRG